MHSRKVSIFLHHYMLSMIIGVCLIFLLGAVIFLGAKYMSLKTETEVLSTEVTQLELENKVQASNLSAQEATDLKKVLSQLIPEREDFFSIVYALEKISVDTGFNITSYNLILPETDSSKLTLAITGKGDTDSFLKFVNAYAYNGGRFITTDAVKYDSKAVDEVSFNLSFYSEQPTESLEVQTLTPEDLENLKAIQGKISVTVIQDENTNTEYPVKSNPF